MIQLIALSCMLFLVACSSTEVSKKDPTPPKGVIPSKIMQIPISQASTAHFSDDNIIVFSKIAQRPVGNFQQLFSYNLETKTTHRNTYQKAHNLPQFAYNNKIYFVSDMHESKRAAYNKMDKQKKPENPLQPAFRGDLYSMSKTGSRIKQLTRNDGYEGDLTLLKGGTTGVFSRKFKGTYQLYRLNLKNTKSLKATNSNINKRFAHALAKNNKLVWTGFQSGSLLSNLYVSNSWGQKPKLIPLPEGMHLHPQWHPMGEWIIFSSNMEDKNNFEIYATKPDSSCLVRLTYKYGDDFYPRFDSKGFRFVFSNVQQSLSSVYITDFVPSPACRNQIK